MAVVCLLNLTSAQDPPPRPGDDPNRPPMIGGTLPPGETLVPRPPGETHRPGIAPGPPLGPGDTPWPRPPRPDEGGPPGPAPPNEDGLPPGPRPSDGSTPPPRPPDGASPPPRTSSSDDDDDDSSRSGLGAGRGAAGSSTAAPQSSNTVVIVAAAAIGVVVIVVIIAIVACLLIKNSRRHDEVETRVVAVEPNSPREMVPYGQPSRSNNNNSDRGSSSAGSGAPIVMIHGVDHRNRSYASTSSDTNNSNNAPIGAVPDGKVPAGMNYSWNLSAKSQGANDPIMLSMGTLGRTVGSTMGNGSQPAAKLGASTKSLMSDGSVTLNDTVAMEECELIRADQYQKMKMIGRGANGSVFSILLINGKTIAMKELGLAVEDFRRAVAEIDNEMEVMRQISHPNIVQYYSAKCDPSEMKILVFMELVTGGSLGSMARAMNQPMNESVVQRFMRQATEGLAHIHSKGIVHRDLKGDNMLLTADGHVKLADFGTARAVGLQSKGAQTMLGTPLFMAPEILVESEDSGEIGYGMKADVWSLGITAGELLNRGIPPWPQFSNPGQAFIHIASPESIPLVAAHASDLARDFIMKACTRDPAKRPTSAQLLEHPWLTSAPSMASSMLVLDDSRSMTGSVVSDNHHKSVSEAGNSTTQVQM